jgi:low affinity Fe/Cu permease
MAANRGQLFTRIARGTARLAGRPLTFCTMLFLVIVWGVSGPYFRYSDSWQLTINTGTTIFTFLMVFLIQNTQNRDSEAIQIKLDELIRCLDGAHNALLDLEELEEEDLLKMHASYLHLAERARAAMKRGKPDTDVPEV